MRQLSLVVLIAALCLVDGNTSLSAQHRHPELSLTVDGAQHPELISDSLALQHFLLAVGVPASTSSVDRERRESLLATAKLPPADNDIIRSAMSEASMRLLPIASGRPEDRAARQLLLENVATSLIAQLSPQGRLTLETFVRLQVKPKIKIYGDSPATATR